MHTASNWQLICEGRRKSLETLEHKNANYGHIFDDTHRSGIPYARKLMTQTKQ